ncbi:MAG: FliH/SctL family protein [Syntrophus sp. (in: bacteria)]|nr:FliH/SctL family protein [Syntrophus sp. (in: bacteria)]
MSRQTRIIKSQNVSYVSQPTGGAMEFMPLMAPGREPREEKRGSPEETRKQEIETILQQAKQQMDEVRKSAYEQGYAAALSEASEAQKKEMLRVESTLQALARELGTFKEKSLETAERQVLDLCFAMAEMVVHKEISTDQSVILNVLRAAFRNIVERENIKVRLNPSDFQYMVQIKNDFMNSMDGFRNVFFEEDGAIARGGAMIETTSGYVDARISEQLNEIKSGLLNLQAP